MVKSVHASAGRYRLERRALRGIPGAVVVALVLSILACASSCRSNSITRGTYYVGDEKLDPEYQLTDVAGLITIASAEDVKQRREALTRFIWRDRGFPVDRRPSAVAPRHRDDQYGDLANLDHIDMLTVEMDFGVDSKIYHFHPSQGNGRLFLYHQGHTGDFNYGKYVIAALLKEGYAVLAFAMPLVGMNSRPLVDLPRLGKHRLVKHRRFILLESETFTPMFFFMEPIAVALNHAMADQTYRSVSMMGISGGGWATTVYAALDPRIQRSYPVAGSLPFFLRSKRHRNTWGDYEQNLPTFYRIANYLELYLMGVAGSGRSQLQILNKYDSCCFSGISHETYQDEIQRRASALGGLFDIIVDDSHREHKISPVALKRILDREKQR